MEDNLVFKEFIKMNIWGNLIIYVGLTIPLGFAYGSTSSNVYYAMREDVEDVKLREFALGNVRQVCAYGQILGNLVSMIFTS